MIMAIFSSTSTSTRQNPLSEGTPSSNGFSHSIPSGTYDLDVKNPSSFSRWNEVIRYTLTLSDGELSDPNQIIVVNKSSGQEVLSGILSSTVVKYESNFVYKVDVAFQDDFEPNETKSYQIRTGETTSLTGDMEVDEFLDWIWVYDGSRTYTIQKSHSLFHFSEGVYVQYENTSQPDVIGWILVRVSGDQLTPDHTNFQMAWGSPTSEVIDKNNVMVSVHLKYEQPIMANWGVGTEEELYKDVDILYAEVTINFYNDRPMIETLVKKRINEKIFNHNGFVMELSRLYDGDANYHTIFGNSDHTIATQNTRGYTWELENKTYGGIDIGNYSAPEFTDLDNDEDFDMVIGTQNGSLVYYENTGNASTPVWTLDETMFMGIDVGNRSSPDLIDLDSDGDQDLVIGNESGMLTYYENTGSPSTPLWTFNSTMFMGIDVGDYSTPKLADLDDDTDLDLIIGNGIGNLSYYENIGTSSDPIWNKNNTMFKNINEGDTRMPTTFAKTKAAFSAPEFGDVDLDGDLDLISGVEYAWFGSLIYFENVGSTLQPSFTRLYPALFNNVRGGTSTADKDHTSPELVDLDNDGGLDIILGTKDGTLTYFRNVGKTSAERHVNSMQPLQNTSYRFYYDQDGNDGPYVIENYSDDFNDYYVIANPSTSNAILRYIPQYDELVYKDEYCGDRFIYSGGNVSYYPFISEEDGFVGRGIIISRPAEASDSTPASAQGGSYISQTGTAGGFIQVPMTARSYDSREVLLTEIDYTTDYAEYDKAVERLKTPMIIYSSSDLFVDEQDIKVSPPDPTEGSIVALQAKIQNIGYADAENVEVEFFDEDPDAGGQKIGETQVISLIKPSEEKQVQVDWDTTGNKGYNEIYVKIDGSNNISELDELNNIANNSIWVFSWSRVWSDEIQITQDSNNSMAPTIVEDSNGRIWVAWQTYTIDDNFDIHARYFVDGAWSEEQKLVENSHWCNSPDLAADDYGNIWLTYASNIEEWYDYLRTKSAVYYWSEKNDVYIKKFNGTNWLESTRVTQAEDRNNSDQTPRIIVDNDKLWVVYRDTHFAFYEGGNQMNNIPYKDMNISAAYFDGNNWSIDLVVCNDSGSQGWWGGPGIAKGTDGKIWFVWGSEISDTQWDVFARYYESGSWSEKMQLTTNPGNDFRPRIAVDSSNVVWVVWESDRNGNKDIYIKYYNGSWSSEIQLTNDSSGDIKPAITTDVNGNLWVVWESYRNNNKDIFLKRYNGTSWSQDIQVTNNTSSDECPTLVSTKSGDVWIVWETDRNGIKDVYARRLINTISFNITLKLGWNLISVPLVQSSTKMEDVLSDIEGQYDIIRHYDPYREIDLWESYDSFKPSGVNDLSNIDHKIAFWINITDIGDGILTVYGSQPSSTQIHMKKGWNHIGYPSNTDRTVGEVKDDITSQNPGIVVELIQNYSEEEPYHLRTMQDSDIMYAGNGYWIKVSDDCVWTVYW